MEASAGVWHRVSSPTDIIIIKYKNELFSLSFHPSSPDSRVLDYFQWFEWHESYKTLLFVDSEVKAYSLFCLF